ncbi:MAG: hypothetical protein RL660_1374 [Bacteroidota bacterium]|jgi:hypothetical protein
MRNLGLTVIRQLIASYLIRYSYQANAAATSSEH